MFISSEAGRPRDWSWRWRPFGKKQEEGEQQVFFFSLFAWHNVYSRTPNFSILHPPFCIIHHTPYMPRQRSTVNIWRLQFEWQLNHRLWHFWFLILRMGDYLLRYMLRTLILFELILFIDTVNCQSLNTQQPKTNTTNKELYLFINDMNAEKGRVNFSSLFSL